MSNAAVEFENAVPFVSGSTLAPATATAGLLAGETLQLQLRQLERAHQDQDRRELEITKHVSPGQRAPMALLRLKETGRCEVELLELLFDMDHPGHHYMRRIKSVSVPIPAVTGPYASVNATLTMLANQTRVAAGLPGGKFERDLENEDRRFVADFTPIQAIVTSSGQNDSGLFELGVNDERYLPFESAGAASRWRIEIDQDCNRFDLGTIADVVLHLRYTARDGGRLLAQKAKQHWKNVVADAASAPQARLFSLRHEFPTEWHRFRSVPEANGQLGGPSRSPATGSRCCSAGATRMSGASTCSASPCPGSLDHAARPAATRRRTRPADLDVSHGWTDGS